MTLAGGSMQWGGLTFAISGATLMTGTRTLDAAGRTGFISYTQTGTPATMYQSHTYTYDRDRVKKMVREQGYIAEEMAWEYACDAKGQVTNADKRFSTTGTLSSTYVAGHQTDDTYDEAGNRLTKKRGGEMLPEVPASAPATTRVILNGREFFIDPDGKELAE